MIVVSATYTGNGTAQTVAIPGSPGTPVFILVKAATGAQVPAAWSTTMGLNAAKPLSGASALTTGIITSVGASSFGVGVSLLSNATGVTYYYLAIVDDGSGDVAVGSYLGTGAVQVVNTGIGTAGLTVPVTQYENNESGVTYHYLAMAKSSMFSVGTFVGDGIDGHNVTPFTLTPDAVWSQPATLSNAAAIRFQDHVGDSSTLIGGNNNDADRIQAFIASGFQLGGSDAVNNNGVTYHAVGFKEGTSAGPTGASLDLFLTMAATARNPGWKTSDMASSDWHFSFSSAIISTEGITLAAPADPTQYRLMLSDGADPDVATLNITGDNIPGSPLIKVERGRESAVLGMTPRAGQATLKLKNSGMAYSLDEPTPGLAVRLNKYYSGAWHNLWQGNLDMPSHRMSNWRPEVQLRALGTLTKLAGRKVSTELYKNITTGAAIGHLLDAAGFPAALRDIDAGDVTLPYWWLSDEDAQSALWTILASEGITAEIYEDGQGRITFRSRSARYAETRSTAIQSTFYNTGTNPLLTEFDYEAGYREVINYASHDRYRRTDDTAPSVVWSDTPDFYYIVPPNGSITVEARATEPFFDAITPVAGVDFLYGFDLPTVTLERTSGQRTKITFTTGAGGTTLTALQLRGTATINNATYTEISSIDNTASVAAYGLRPWSGSMSKELDFATMRDNLDAIVSWKQTPRGRVTVSINAAQSTEANTATALREIGDRVRVIETNLDFDGECWIEHISHEVHAPAGPTDGSVVGNEVTTYECSVIVVAGGSLGTGLGATNPYSTIDNSVYVATGGSLDDYGITMMGASIF